jgi:hypothetical protein
MVRSLPAHRTLFSAPIFKREAKTQRLLLGIDKDLSEYAVWVEMNGPEGPGRRPLLFSSDLDRAIERYNSFIEELVEQGYQSAEPVTALSPELINL